MFILRAGASHCSKAAPDYKAAAERMAGEVEFGALNCAHTHQLALKPRSSADPACDWCLKEEAVGSQDSISLLALRSTVMDRAIDSSLMDISVATRV